MSDNKLNVVLLWHMHQPDYRDLSSDAFIKPWTYLHCIKDYADMAMHLENNSKAKAVINFTPILLEQIDIYAKQLTDFKNTKAPISDPILSALSSSKLPGENDNRIKLVHACVKINKDRVLSRYPVYKRLVNLSEQLNSDSNIINYFNDQFIFDLLVWYHLSWLAEYTKRNDLRIKKLLLKEQAFDFADRMVLMTVITELIVSIIPRYKSLAENKQIELSTTPYTHPIVPLLLDLESGTQAMPEAEMPCDKIYAGGEQRAEWHIQKGLEVFKQHFGFIPKGCWPSEGAISTETTQLLQDNGFSWFASGAGVFWNSVNQIEQHDTDKGLFYEHRPNQISGQRSVCFFRDDHLSDLIGFEYSTWHADDAVANFVNKLENYSNVEEGVESIISIILDGENAWEHYPENGYHFLNALYESLSNHKNIHLTTYSDYLETLHTTPQQLPSVVAGSWVYGTLSTWIGSSEKNRGWEMLCEAKRYYDKKIEADGISEEYLEKLKKQLALCEGSDWFWWFGDYNTAETVSDFEQLYRMNLSNLYKLMNITPPEYLSVSFTYGHGDPVGGGAMIRSGD